MSTTLTSSIAAAKQKIYDWIATGDFLKVKIVVGQTEVTLRSLDDAVGYLKKLDAMAAAAAESDGVVSRTVCAINGGRGYRLAEDREG